MKIVLAVTLNQIYNALIAIEYLRCFYYILLSFPTTVWLSET